MAVLFTGIVFIGVGLIFAPALGKILIGGAHVAGGWLLASLAGYGTVYAVVAGTTFAGFVVIELGHHARRR